jgi:putative two-component system response regulator
MDPTSDLPVQRAPIGGSILSFSVLLVPALAVFLLPAAWAEVSGPLWFLALVPTFRLAAQRGWEGAAVAMGVTVAILVVVHLGAGSLGRPVPDTLFWVLPLLLATAAGVGWLADRLRSDVARGGASGLMDPTTGLPSEQQAKLLLQNEFWAAERGRPVCLVLFDLDDFAAYARNQGQEAATRAVTAFGEILNSTTRRMNLSGRLGPGRFLSILDGSDEEGAIGFAERVREAFAQTRIPGGPLTVSAGIAGYHASMTRPDDLVAAAELALQRAREAGGDCVRLFGRPASASAPLPGTQGGSGPGRPAQGPRVELETGPRAEAGVLEGQDRRVLLVEEETAVRTLISTHLQKLGFQVTEAQDAVEGGKLLAEEYDVVISDLRLPGLPGHDLVSTVKARWPATPVIVVTGFRDARLAAEALNSGADRYLFKPFGMAELETLLADLLDRRDRLRLEREERRKTPDDEEGRTRAARAAILDGARALAAAVEVMDPYTRGHVTRVTDYSLALLEAMGERAQGIEAEGLRLACELHDVGKLSVPAAILNKEGPLTEEEYREVREHPRTSRRLLEHLIEDELVLAVAAWHHERWDGKGYPDHLAGEAIPLPARIVAIADCLDAMTSPRAYRAGLEWDDAVEQVRARTGTQFDPGLLEIFEAALPRIRHIYDRSFPEGPTRSIPRESSPSGVPSEGEGNPEPASG